MKAKAGERLWTLVELADGLGIDPASLRQRIARGTLEAVKLGRDWFVTDSVARPLVDARVAEVEARARAIVLKRVQRRRPSGVDQHGGRA